MIVSIPMTAIKDYPHVSEITRENRCVGKQEYGHEKSKTQSIGHAAKGRGTKATTEEIPSSQRGRHVREV